MSIVKNAILFAFASAITLACSQKTLACSCIREEPSSLAEKVRKAKNEANAVLTAKVIKIQDGNDETPKIITFLVKKSLKGDLTRTIEIVTGSDDGDCGFPFQVNGTYLIYAHFYKSDGFYLSRAKGDKNGGLATSQCSRTRLLSKVSKEEIAALSGRIRK